MKNIGANTSPRGGPSRHQGFADVFGIGQWSDDLNGDTVCVSSERLKVGAVAGDDGATGFSERDEKCVHCGTALRETSEPRCPSCRWRADLRVDDACLEESIQVGVAPGVALQ